VKENNLPISLASIISTQIEQQIALHLQKRLKNFCQLYEAKANEVPNPENPDAQRKINNSNFIIFLPISIPNCRNKKPYPSCTE